MDGITDFDIKFKRSLIEQLDKMNFLLQKIVQELETSNNLKEFGARQD